MKIPVTIILGAYVKDTITGFAGIVIARTEFLNSTPKVLIQPCSLRNSQPIESVWFDQAQVIACERESSSMGLPSPLNR